MNLFLHQMRFLKSSFVFCCLLLFVCYSCGHPENKTSHYSVKASINTEQQSVKVNVDISYLPSKATKSIEFIAHENVIIQSCSASGLLNYNEPPDWFFSVRHHLGAVQIEAKKYEDAIITYEEDLKRLPKNGWALHGLKLAYSNLKEINKTAEIDERLRTIWATADIELSSSRIK